MKQGTSPLLPPPFLLHAPKHTLNSSPLPLSLSKTPRLPRNKLSLPSAPFGSCSHPNRDATAPITLCQHKRQLCLSDTSSSSSLGLSSQFFPALSSHKNPGAFFFFFFFLWLCAFLSFNASVSQILFFVIPTQTWRHRRDQQSYTGSTYG